MNLAILHTNTQDFILENLDTDITKLVLKGSPFKTITTQELAEQIISKKKCKKKLPTWFLTKNIYYPNKLHIEQTSSEITATYKASLINGNSIVDLTGGFGVDCLAFSKQFKKVIHCEIHANLSKITKHNYKKIGVTNIETIITDGIQFLENTNKKFDWIYVDPSRRDDLEKRVFLLENCLPNVPENVNLLFECSKNILVKTAPILDITAAIKVLVFVKEVHVIAVNNEVKEVLYILEKGYNSRLNFKTINSNKNKKQIFNFNLSFDEASYAIPKKYLFEPNAAILKIGAFQEVSTQLKIDKLHKHTHLYTSKTLIDFPGRRFLINKVMPYSIKKLKKEIIGLKANITIRNFPETVAQIRKRTKLKDGGDLYLFFTTNLNEERIVIFCEKI